MMRHQWMYGLLYGMHRVLKEGIVPSDVGEEHKHEGFVEVIC